MLELGTLKAISSILIAVSVTFISWPKKWGLYVMAVAQPIICYCYFADGNYWWGAMAIYLTLINLVGIYNWKRKKVG